MITEVAKRLEDLGVKSIALDCINEGIVICDMKHDDCPIVYCNKAFCTLTQYTPEEIIGKNCRFLQNDLRKQSQLIDLKEAIENGSRCKVVLKNFKKDGTMFFNELSLAPIISESGEVEFYIGVQKDITDLMETIKKLEKLNKFLSAES